MPHSAISRLSKGVPVLEPIEYEVQAIKSQMQSEQDALALLKKEQAERACLQEEVAALERELEEHTHAADEERGHADTWRRELAAANVTIADLNAELSDLRDHALGAA